MMLKKASQKIKISSFANEGINSRDRECMVLPKPGAQYSWNFAGIVLIAAQCGSRGLDLLGKVSVSESRFFSSQIESSCLDCLCVFFISGCVNVQKTSREHCLLGHLNSSINVSLPSQSLQAKRLWRMSVLKDGPDRA